MRTTGFLFYIVVILLWLSSHNLSCIHAKTHHKHRKQPKPKLPKPHKSPAPSNAPVPSKAPTPLNAPAPSVAPTHSNSSGPPKLAPVPSNVPPSEPPSNVILGPYHAPAPSPVLTEAPTPYIAPAPSSKRNDSNQALDTIITGTNSSTNFNVLNYGAKGDGIADDTSAFEAAWAGACKVQGSTVLVPSGSLFFVMPITFLGKNCFPDIVFQLDGTIIASQSPEDWKSGLLEWLNFSMLKGITIRGQGTIDGRGSPWWEINGEPKVDMPSTKPTALRFYGSTNAIVTGITIKNTPQTHLKFDNCSGVQVSNINVSSPGDSPNTDGIHLQNTQDVLIHTSTIACGDDCISIQTGCSHVYVHNINCGPGHGISIGSLGKDGTKACVSNITVRDSVMQNTMNGVRIKTWQGGSGSVESVMFSNIQVSEVVNPIIIDQFYCNGGKCSNKTSAVAISGISYQSIKGTYTNNPVHFACSDTMPCAGITLSSIELNPSSQVQPKTYNPYCYEAFGELRTVTTPPISCLQTGNPSRASAGGLC